MQMEPSLRASDADREQAAERLRHATAEGRLTADELEGRLQALFGARTYAELDALLADLPADRSLSQRRVRVAPWAAAVAALTLMVLTLGALTIARLHRVAAVAITGPGGSQRFRVPAPALSHFAFRPPLADPNDGLIVAASMAAVLAVLLVCAAVLWVLMQSTGRVGRLKRPPSRSP